MSRNSNGAVTKGALFVLGVVVTILTPVFTTILTRLTEPDADKPTLRVDIVVSQPEATVEPEIRLPLGEMPVDFESFMGSDVATMRTLLETGESQFRAFLVNRVTASLTIPREWTLTFTIHNDGTASAKEVRLGFDAASSTVEVGAEQGCTHDDTEGSGVFIKCDRIAENGVRELSVTIEIPAMGASQARDRAEEMLSEELTDLIDEAVITAAQRGCLDGVISLPLPSPATDESTSIEAMQVPSEGAMAALEALASNIEIDAENHQALQVDGSRVEVSLETRQSGGQPVAEPSSGIGFGVVTLKECPLG